MIAIKIKKKYMIRTYWTIQGKQQVEFLKDNGYITGSLDMLSKDCPMYQDFYRSYLWMIRKMTYKFGMNIPKELLATRKNISPIWLWTTKPDNILQYEIDSKDSYLLEVSLDDSRVLLSDFELWHFVLNGWILEHNFFYFNLKTFLDNFYKNRTDKDNYPLINYNSITNKTHKTLISDSWLNIFDVDYGSNSILQGTTWQIKDVEVVSIHKIT